MRNIWVTATYLLRRIQFSDDRTPDSIEQGEHIIATYTGGLAESFPAQIHGTILIQFVK